MHQPDFILYWCGRFRPMGSLPFSAIHLSPFGGFNFCMITVCIYDLGCLHRASSSTACIMIM